MGADLYAACHNCRCGRGYNRPIRTCNLSSTSRLIFRLHSPYNLRAPTALYCKVLLDTGPAAADPRKLPINKTHAVPSKLRVCPDPTPTAMFSSHHIEQAILISLTSHLPLHESLITLTHSQISQHQLDIMTISKSLPPRTDLMRWDEEADEPYILLPSHPDLRLTPWRETDVDDAVSCAVRLQNQKV